MLTIRQRKARLATLHCGCISWHIRRYRRKAFYEPLSVLPATLTLWAYSSYASCALPPVKHQYNKHRQGNLGRGSLLESDASLSGSIIASPARIY